VVFDLRGEISRLLAWGLTDERAIVDGDLELSSMAGRNRNLRLRRRRGASYLIKRAEPGRAGRYRLRAEAAFYDLCRQQPRLAPVAALMARPHAFFADESVLVLEIVDGGRPFWRHLRAGDSAELSPQPARACGAALAVVHASFRDPEIAGAASVAALATSPPWILRLHRPGPEALRRVNPARKSLLEILQREAAIADMLSELAAGWQVETVIHGDVRSGNLLVVAGEDGSAGVRLIDWESVQRGDPAWDVAGMLQEVLLFWLRGMPPDPELAPEPRAGEAAYPLPVLRPLADAFWHGYLAAADLDPETAARLRLRSVRLAGARLLQTAWEHSRHRERLTSLAVLLLQVGANVLADAEGAAVRLFGWTAQGRGSLGV
jgi:aminoglycoside phosphotransferase (APT) family kinase protein